MEFQMCVATYLKSRQPVRIARHAIPIVLDGEIVAACSLPRVMVMVFAWASIEFSTNSAIAFRGLLCESAMIRIAFQSSPMRSFPLSLAFDFMPGWRGSGGNAFGVQHKGLALGAGQALKIEGASTPRSIGRAAPRLLSRFAQKTGVD